MNCTGWAAGWLWVTANHSLRNRLPEVVFPAQALVHGCCDLIDPGIVRKSKPTNDPLHVSLLRIARRSVCPSTFRARRLASNRGWCNHGQPLQGIHEIHHT